MAGPACLGPHESQEISWRGAGVFAGRIWAVTSPSQDGKRPVEEDADPASPVFSSPARHSSSFRVYTPELTLGQRGERGGGLTGRDKERKISSRGAEGREAGPGSGCQIRVNFSLQLAGSTPGRGSGADAGGCEDGRRSAGPTLEVNGGGEAFSDGEDLSRRSWLLQCLFCHLCNFWPFESRYDRDADSAWPRSGCTPSCLSRPGAESCSGLVVGWRLGVHDTSSCSAAWPLSSGTCRKPPPTTRQREASLGTWSAKCQSLAGAEGDEDLLPRAPRYYTPISSCTPHIKWPRTLAG